MVVVGVVSHTQARIPRLMWESLIAMVAFIASLPNDNNNNNNGSSFSKHHSSSSPAFCILLALMTGVTSLFDIFVWAPGYALSTGLFGSPLDMMVRTRRVCVVI